jgi:hypothetical protein
MHINERLREHEASLGNITNMNSWNELRVRLMRNETIDKEFHHKIKKERKHIRKILLTIVADLML